MDTKPNKDILMQLMLKHGMNRKDIEEITGRSEITIRQWLGSAGNDVPFHMLKIIKLKIGDER